MRNPERREIPACTFSAVVFVTSRQQQSEANDGAHNHEAVRAAQSKMDSLEKNRQGTGNRLGQGKDGERER